jgi:hypothetical protein
MNDDFSKSLYFLYGKLASDIMHVFKESGVIKKSVVHFPVNNEPLAPTKLTYG